MARKKLTDGDYRRLARFRHALRRFLRFSENAARRFGISPTQYQLLLFVRGFPERRPTITDLAERLQIRHQSAVGLIDRCERARLVRRQRDREDGRRVLVALTGTGANLLGRLADEHFRQLQSLREAFPLPLVGEAVATCDPQEGRRRARRHPAPRRSSRER